MMDLLTVVRLLVWAVAIVSGVMGVNLILMWHYVKERESHDRRD